MKQNIIFVLALCLLLITCSDSNDPIKEIENKDPFIILKKETIDFTNEGGSEAILVESNVTWTVKSSASWCTISPSSGNKSTESINLSANANEDYDNRSCTVTIESGNISKIVTLFQSQKDAIILSQKDFELTSKAQLVELEIKTNIDYEVMIPKEAKDWVTLAITRALRTEEVVLDIGENKNSDKRTVEVIVKDKKTDLQETVTILQDGLSIADKLEKEKLIIKQFIEDNNLIILDKYPEDNVFKSNEFFFDSTSGLYFNVIDPGNSRKIKKGEEFYIRFKGLKYISSKDTATYSNMYSAQPEILVYGNIATYPSVGWVIPLNKVGDRARVKMIVPFNLGLPNDQPWYKTAYYEELRYLFEQ